MMKTIVLMMIVALSASYEDIYSFFNVTHTQNFNKNNQQKITVEMIPREDVEIYVSQVKSINFIFEQNTYDEDDYLPFYNNTVSMIHDKNNNSIIEVQITYQINNTRDLAIQSQEPQQSDSSLRNMVQRPELELSLPTLSYSKTQDPVTNKSTQYTGGDKKNQYFHNKVIVKNDKLRFQEKLGQITWIQLEITPKISWAQQYLKFSMMYYFSRYRLKKMQAFYKLPSFFHYSVGMSRFIKNVEMFTGYIVPAILSFILIGLMFCKDKHCIIQMFNFLQLLNVIQYLYVYDVSHSRHVLTSMDIINFYLDVQFRVYYDQFNYGKYMNYRYIIKRKTTTTFIYNMRYLMMFCAFYSLVLLIFNKKIKDMKQYFFILFRLVSIPIIASICLQFTQDDINDYLKHDSSLYETIQVYTNLIATFLVTTIYILIYFMFAYEMYQKKVMKSKKEYKSNIEFFSYIQSGVNNKGFLRQIYIVLNAIMIFNVSYSLADSGEGTLLNAFLIFPLILMIMIIRKSK